MAFHLRLRSPDFAAPEPGVTDFYIGPDPDIGLRAFPDPAAFATEREALDAAGLWREMWNREADLRIEAVSRQ